MARPEIKNKSIFFESVHTPYTKQTLNICHQLKFPYHKKILSKHFTAKSSLIHDVLWCTYMSPRPQNCKFLRKLPIYIGTAFATFNRTNIQIRCLLYHCVRNSLATLINKRFHVFLERRNIYNIILLYTRHFNSAAIIAKV